MLLTKLILTCLLSIHGPGADLCKGFIDVLNTKDGDKIAAFLKENSNDQSKVVGLAPRIIGFSQQAAPIAMEGTPTESESKTEVQIQTQDGMVLKLTLSHTGGVNPKILGLMIRPVQSPGKALDFEGSLASLAQNTLQVNPGTPGISIATSSNGKKESAVAGFRKVGTTDAISVDDPFHIGSIGKPICSTLVGLLIDQGKLRWDSKLGELLKGVKMRPEYADVTVTQLMQHRSGIPQDQFVNDARVRSASDGQKSGKDIRGKYTEMLLSEAPVGKPGERFAYSNAGYSILGHVCEVVAGKPYEELIKSLIFKPLGLQHSFTAIDVPPAQRPSGHWSKPSGPEPGNYSGPIEFMFAPAGGGMWMSPGDLVRFGEEHLKGLQGKDGLLKSATVQKLHEGVAERPGEEEFKYACGWGIDSVPNIEVFHGHNGSNGTMRSELMIFPRSGLVCAAIVNVGGEREPSPSRQALLAIARKLAAQR